MLRLDGRKPREIRPVVFTPNFVVYPEGSVLIAMGGTKVLCNVTVENGVPRWMQDQGKAGGWITGEYAMLPRSTQSRSARETRISSAGRQYPPAPIPGRPPARPDRPANRRSAARSGFLPPGPKTEGTTRSRSRARR